MGSVRGALVLAACCGVVSAIATGLVRAYVLHHDLLDRPNERSSHVTPTPRGGGLAVLFAATIGLGVAAMLGLVTVGDAAILGVGMVALGVVGWLDDTRALRARSRLMAHLTVAIGTMWALHGLPAVRIGTGVVELGLAGYLLGVLGIAWSINLFNFMDGIDGFAGSQSVLIFGTGAWLLLLQGSLSLGTVSAILAAASAGFLVWNWPPAKIFMGDVGSGSIGYLVAALAVASENRGSVPILAFAIVGGVFVCDATVTLVRRLWRGDRVWEAHRDHAYQRLTRAWGGHRPVTLAALTVGLVLAGFAVLGTLRPSLLVVALLLSYLLLAALLLATERRAPP
jgi:Fuc2NAc and GlcNAc transferase